VKMYVLGFNEHAPMEMPHENLSTISLYK
jgi:hypothetical protein